MRYYLDTEFLERGHEHPVQLISIGMVREDGAAFYAVCRDGWRVEDCSDWLFDNVLRNLRGPWMTRKDIAAHLMEWMWLGEKRNDPSKCEVWGYFADYDWVLFCQLFGRMVDMPSGLPFFCRDVKQLMDERGLQRSEMPEQTGAEHNALDDAIHIKTMHEFIMGLTSPDLARPHPAEGP